jgi:hypothetical protein
LLAGIGAEHATHPLPGADNQSDPRIRIARQSADPNRLRLRQSRRGEDDRKREYPE